MTLREAIITALRENGTMSRDDLRLEVSAHCCRRVSDRKLRDEISAIVDEFACAIIEAKGGGYKIAQTEAERQGAAAYLRSYADQIMRRHDGLLLCPDPALVLFPSEVGRNV